METPVSRGMIKSVNTATLVAHDSSRRRFRIAVIAASVVAAIAGSVLLATRDSGEKATTRGITAPLPVPGHPGSVVAGPDALWVALNVIDADAREFHGPVDRVVQADDAVWALEVRPGKLLRLGPSTLAPRYRSVKGEIAKITTVTVGTKGTITYVVRIKMGTGSTPWTITSATKSYARLRGKGTLTVDNYASNPYTFVMKGTVSR